MHRIGVVVIIMGSLAAPLFAVKAQSGTTKRAQHDSVLVLKPVQTTAMPVQVWPDHAALRAATRAARDSLLRELASARERWAPNATRRIEYRLQEPCSCVFSVSSSTDLNISAIGDSIITIHNNRSIPADTSTHARRSVGYLFARAEQAILTDADEVVVVFDPVFGIPRRIWVDPNKAGTDDEYELLVSDIVRRP